MHHGHQSARLLIPPLPGLLRPSRSVYAEEPSSGALSVVGEVDIAWPRSVPNRVRFRASVAKLTNGRGLEGMRGL